MTFYKTCQDRRSPVKALLMIKFLLLACIMATTNVYADALSMPLSDNIDQFANTPKQGIDMQKVEDQYGAPSERIAAVGEPAITRWVYPTFTVFFENDKVLHSVIHRS